jgi:hypothetical protein
MVLFFYFKDNYRRLLIIGLSNALMVNDLHSEIIQDGYL